MPAITYNDNSGQAFFVGVKEQLGVIGIVTVENTELVTDKIGLEDPELLTSVKNALDWLRRKEANSLPFKVTVKFSEVVKGGSIGAATAVAVQNLMDSSFKPHYLVATGTVSDEDGSIGKVNGVEVKVFAAERNKLTLFAPHKSLLELNTALRKQFIIASFTSLEEMKERIKGYYQG